MRFSQACENNKMPILAQLKLHLAGASKVLEIGSGTGQHAAFFAHHMKHLAWQPCDVKENHQSIAAWVAQAKCDNVLAPVPFFIGVDQWSFDNVDAVYTANTAHIMQPDEVKLMMETVATHLPNGGLFFQYGPFCVSGEFTSQSNADFDTSLRQQGYGGIRDIAELQSWTPTLTLTQIVEMPANNFLLVWQK